jgi:hypothetical protein
VTVAEASDEAIEKEQNTVNAARERAKSATAPDWRDLPDVRRQSASANRTLTSKTDAAVDYESKTVPELKELAAKRNVDVPSDAVKADYRQGAGKERYRSDRRSVID